MKIFLVAGYAGSGKTKVAHDLSFEKGLAILDKDILSEPFIQALNAVLTGDIDDRHSDTYLEHIRPLEYKVFCNAIMDNVRNQVSIVATAPYLKELISPDWLGNFRSTVAEFGAEVVVIWVDCDVDVMRDRIINRGLSRDTWKLTHWDEYTKGLNPSLYKSKADIVIDNTLDR